MSSLKRVSTSRRYQTPISHDPGERIELESFSSMSWCSGLPVLLVAAHVRTSSSPELHTPTTANLGGLPSLTGRSVLSLAAHAMTVPWETRYFLRRRSCCHLAVPVSMARSRIEWRRLRRSCRSTASASPCRYVYLRLVIGFGRLMK
jgi:hypothetical protein